MKRYRVTFTPEAVEQINAQVMYIAERSAENARRWKARLQTAIESIGDLPAHAIDATISGHLGFEVRRYVFERNYLVHYCIEEGEHRLRILNFRHVAQQPSIGEP